MNGGRLYCQQSSPRCNVTRVLQCEMMFSETPLDVPNHDNLRREMRRSHFFFCVCVFVCRLRGIVGNMNAAWRREREGGRGCDHVNILP